VITNVNYGDIEGVWTYVYYSYSVDAKRAVGFVKYANQSPKRIEMGVQHPTTKYVKFILGGTDNKRYPGFNGQFHKIHFSARPGAFIDKMNDLSGFMK
jgi:hypothetical protein